MGGSKPSGWMSKPYGTRVRVLQLKDKSKNVPKNLIGTIVGMAATGFLVLLDTTNENVETTGGNTGVEELKDQSSIATVPKQSTKSTNMNMDGGRRRSRRKSGKGKKQNKSKRNHKKH